MRAAMDVLVLVMVVMMLVAVSVSVRVFMLIVRIVVMGVDFIAMLVVVGREQ